VFKKTCIVLLLAFLLIPSNVYAYSEYIYAGGENIGIEIKTNGVVVVGTYKINKNDLQDFVVLANMTSKFYAVHFFHLDVEQ